MMKKYICIAAVILVSAGYLCAQVKSPEEFLGYKVGSDYKLARWDKIVEYFKMIDTESEWIEVQELGKSTLGNPFIMAIITSPENMRSLEAYREIAGKLSEPRTINDQEAHLLAEKGKAILLITGNLHSDEVGAAQASMELAYQLITGKNKSGQEALTDTIVLLIPSLNPDGEIMVVDWYNKWLGTDYEGSDMPWLYHQYAGHDNNRDWYMFNLVETRLVSKVYYDTWHPQVILDQHQMGSTGARIFIPPYFDPPNPNVHPLIWRESGLIGAHMAQDLEEEDKAGVIDRAYFTGWWEGASVQTPWWHNIVGILTEMASANIASPVHIEQGELSGNALGLAEYKQFMNFPNPWIGGDWTLRNIIDYELITCYSLLDTVAKYKSDFLYNFYKMGRDAVEKGKNEPPYAFIIPSDQIDTYTMAKMTDILIMGGVEIYKATENFVADNKIYTAGSFIIFLAQPNGRYAKDLLEIQRYPDIRHYPGGPPVSPYDVTGWTLGVQMGIMVDQIQQNFTAKTVTLKNAEYPEGGIERIGRYGYLIETATNNAYKAVNMLLKEKYSLYRATESFKIDDKLYRAGTFIVVAIDSDRDKFNAIALRTNLKPIPIDKKPFVNARRINLPRVGLYKPWIANIDEGWTRLILEKYEFNYTSLDNKTIKAGKLRDIYDVIIMPDMPESFITEGKPKEEWRQSYAELPPEYSGGIDKEGIENIKQFIQDGGFVLFLDSSSELALKHYFPPLINALEKYEEDEFFCPGSLLRVHINNNHPLGFGMPEEAAVLFYSSMAFQTIMPNGKFNRSVVASYPENDVLISGWILGENKLYRKAALVDVKMAKGHMIFYGFRPQHRAQTYGTFKLLFNGIYYSAMINELLPEGE